MALINKIISTQTLISAQAVLLQGGALFSKQAYLTPCLVKVTASTMNLLAGTLVVVDGRAIQFLADTGVEMPTLVAGTDYAVYITTDGRVLASANWTYPAGYTATNSRKIGGFHFNLGSAINPYSIWDLKFRPSCADPRGMALVSGMFWADIYLLGTNSDVEGTSLAGATIADGSSPPKIPALYGGNGTSAYSGLNYWDAAEALAAYGKKHPTYSEFAALAYGVTEAQSSGADPVTNQRIAGYTSKWGIELAAGNVWVWGQGESFRIETTNPAWSWKDFTGGRGQTYTQGDYGLVAPVFGGAWGDAGNAGSRASLWNNYPWFSNPNVGARGRSDHLILV